MVFRVPVVKPPRLKVKAKPAFANRQVNFLGGQGLVLG